MLPLRGKAAVISTLGGMAPEFAVRLLTPCSFQEAECVLLKVLKQTFCCHLSMGISILVFASFAEIASVQQPLWRQVVNKRHYLVKVSVLSEVANLSVFSRLLVSCAFQPMSVNINACSFCK